MDLPRICGSYRIHFITHMKQYSTNETNSEKHWMFLKGSLCGTNDFISSVQVSIQISPLISNWDCAKKAKRHELWIVSQLKLIFQNTLKAEREINVSRKLHIHKMRPADTSRAQRQQCRRRDHRNTSIIYKHGEIRETERVELLKAGQKKLRIHGGRSVSTLLMAHLQPTRSYLCDF